MKGLQIERYMRKQKQMTSLIEGSDSLIELQKQHISLIDRLHSSHSNHNIQHHNRMHGIFSLSILNTATKHFQRLSYRKTLDLVLTFVPLQILFIIKLLHMNLLHSLLFWKFGSNPQILKLHHHRLSSNNFRIEPIYNK
jgi:hypothetical protein